MLDRFEPWLTPALLVLVVLFPPYGFDYFQGWHFIGSQHGMLGVVDVGRLLVELVAIGAAHLALRAWRKRDVRHGVTPTAAPTDGMRSGAIWPGRQ